MSVIRSEIWRWRVAGRRSADCRGARFVGRVRGIQGNFYIQPVSILHFPFWVLIFKEDLSEFGINDKVSAVL